MAKERNSRSFDLDKGGKHSFDLEKKSTRNFELKKDDSENVAASTDIRNQTSSTPPVSQTDNGGDNGDSNSKKWLWVLLCFVVLAILAYLFIPQGQGVQEKSDVDTIETIKDDSTQNKSNAGESSVFSSDVQPASSSSASSDGSNDNSSQSQPSTSPAPTTSQLQSERVQSADVAVESSSESLDEQAQQVIRGVYGNNPERRRKLGAEYEKIQKRVNELMRK